MERAGFQGARKKIFLSIRPPSNIPGVSRTIPRGEAPAVAMQRMLSNNNWKEDGS